MAQYVGNNDFRGYLAALGQQGDNNANNALNYTGNDGGVNRGQLNEYNTAADLSGDTDEAAQQRALAYVNNAYATYQNQNAPASTGGTSGISSQAAYDTQANNLKDLLGRLDTGQANGLSNLNDQYNSNVNQQTNAKNQAIQDYTEQGVQNTKDKQAGYDTANRNANNGYRSLAQIIGRSAGTGSSAFQELLPDAVGKDLSEKRSDIDTTYGQNTASLKKAQDQTELSFSNILADLANQRAKGEQDLRTGVEGQRQSLLGQQQQLEAQRGNTAGVNALQGQIQGSRGTVDSFFNQFKPTITAQQAAIATPELAQYTVDRSNVNAGQSGAPQTSNPYADILRKRLQGGTA